MGRLFQRNESTADRTLRVLFGVFLLSLMLWGPKTMWGLIGLLPLTTGLLGSCPAYTLF
ncbi:MAG: DUF2892 domain-containing protein, partial [Deltaproteobacteria bacterium]|nr:DUF2892 domain-containing protein [Deltaproteobacteria bacterium]